MPRCAVASPRAPGAPSLRVADEVRGLVERPEAHVAQVVGGGAIALGLGREDPAPARQAEPHALGDEGKLEAAPAVPLEHAARVETRDARREPEQRAPGGLAVDERHERDRALALGAHVRGGCPLEEQAEIAADVEALAHCLSEGRGCRPADAEPAISGTCGATEVCRTWIRWRSLSRRKPARSSRRAARAGT